MGTKILICDKIEYIPSTYVTSIDGEDVVLNEGKSFSSLELQSGKFTEETQNGDGGDLATQKLNVDTDILLSESVLLKNMPHIFRLYFSDGETKIWGSLNNPVSCHSMTRTKSNTSFSFERKSNISEF
jgi:hypothetical protein